MAGIIISLGPWNWLIAGMVIVTLVSGAAHAH